MHAACMHGGVAAGSTSTGHTLACACHLRQAEAAKYSKQQENGGGDEEGDTDAPLPPAAGPSTMSAGHLGAGGHSAVAATHIPQQRCAGAAVSAYSGTAAAVAVASSAALRSESIGR